MVIHESELAQELYEAYGDSAERKNFQGNPMPTWEELPEIIKRHWNAVAQHAIYLVQK